MRAVFDIAANELRLIFKDQSIWINLVVIPLVLSFVIGFANGAGQTPGSASALIVDVIAPADADAPDSAVTALLADLRTQNTTLLLCPFDNTADDPCRLDGAELTEALAVERVTAGDALALLIFPPDFTARLNAGESVALTYRSNEDFTAPGFILQAVQAAALHTGAVQVAVSRAEAVAAELPSLTFRDEADRAAFFAGVRESAQAAWATNPIAVEYVVAASAGPNAASGGFSQSVPGIGSMYVMLAILPAVGAFIRARREGTLQRLTVTPVSRAQILGGMLLARYLLGLIQYAIVFGFGFLLGVRFGGDVIALLLVMLAFTLCVTALMIMLTGFIRTEMQASGITLFISLTLAPLGGAWWPLDIVPDWMRVIGHISPIAWAMNAYNALIFHGGGLADVLVPVGVLLAAAAVMFTIGVARFRFD